MSEYGFFHSVVSGFLLARDVPFPFMAFIGAGIAVALTFALASFFESNRMG